MYGLIVNHIGQRLQKQLIVYGKVIYAKWLLWQDFFHLGWNNSAYLFEHYLFVFFPL